MPVSSRALLACWCRTNGNASPAAHHTLPRLTQHPSPPFNRDASSTQENKLPCEPFPKPAPVVLPMSRLAEPMPSWQGPLVDSVSDLKYRLSVLQRNPSPALSAACGRFHAVILQEARDHAPQVSHHFNAYTDGNDVAILLNKDTFEPDAAVISISESFSSKDMWGRAALVVRGLLRRLSLADSPTVTFSSVHIHNKVAKQLDAATALRQRLRAHMLQHNVNFNGGDFNKSASSTVGDVFSDPEFAAPGNALLWGIGGLNETCKDRTGFLIMRHTAAASLTTPTLVLHPATRLRT